MNGGPAAGGRDGCDPAGAWHRLHPLSPVVRSGRGVLAVAVAVAITRSATSGSGWLEVAFLFAAVVAAVISWLVTRWRLDGVTLRIESGLIRRDSRQLPIARIQAVDVVRPFLARALGLAELRVRLAGSSDADGRLAYLTEQAALELRAQLLATHHGLDPATPEPPEHIAVTVPTGRLIGSVALSTAGPAAVMVVLAGAVLAFVSAAALAALAISLVWLLIVCLSLVWRRVSTHVRLHRGAVPGWHPDPPWPARDGGRDHPGAAGAGGADDRAAAVAAAPVVPARGGRGGLAGPGQRRRDRPDAQDPAAGRPPRRDRVPARRWPSGPRCRA